MNSKLKWYTIKVARRILNIFSVIKIIPNRIFFTCYTGEKYTCNPSMYAIICKLFFLENLKSFGNIEPASQILKQK